MAEPAATLQLEEAYAAWDEALGAAGSRKLLLMEQALDLWRTARDTSAAPPPAISSDVGEADASAQLAECWRHR